MKKKIWILAAALALCLMAAMPAMAANVLAFTERSVTLFEGESLETALNREGDYAAGDIAYSSESARVATVSPEGVVTAVARGKTRIIADLMQNGRRVRRATLEVQVLRRVTRVAVNRRNLVVLEADDPTLNNILAPLPEGVPPRTEPVLVLLSGRTVNLNAEVEPKDASNRKVSFTSSDAAVARADGSRIRAVGKGECLLTVASVSNPEVQDVYRVVVIEPVKKIQIDAGDKTVFAGAQKLLTALITPADASIQHVTWTSRRPTVATVDENGLVTGIAKGEATIEAKSTDGTEIVARVTIRVTQEVTEVSLKQEELIVAVNRYATLSATVMPREATNRKVNWSSSDESIATVGRDGRVTGKKAGICVITCSSDSNPSVSANAVVQVVQPVTKITFSNPGGLTFPIRTSQQLYWSVEPADATIQDVTFTSNHPDIASVDATGLVTGIKRGEARITATAADGSKRTGQIKVTVTQPVEGITLPQMLYYIQRGRGNTVRATVLPKDANNKKVYWEVGDEYIATARQSGTSSATVTGLQFGTTGITAITEDGGFVANATLQVADYDAAVMVEGLEITSDNRIRITLRNTSNLVVNRVYFRVDCFDPMDNPMIYNRDGVSTGFDGFYPLPLMPGERTAHGSFNFGDWMDTGMLGAVVLTVTGYEFENGQRWEIPEEYRVPSMKAYSGIWGRVTPTPMPPENPENPEGVPNE